MAHENAPYKVSEPVEGVVRQLARIVNTLLTHIGTGQANLDQFERFLDWFFDLSFEDREEMFTPLDEGPPSYLKLLSGGKLLKISALNGLKLICHSNHLFYYIDSAFKSYTEKGETTPVAHISVYEVTEEGVSYRRLFDSIYGVLENACLTQHQILNFIKLHRKWLQTEFGSTSFLFKSNSSLLVACIVQDDNGLIKVFTDNLNNSPLWEKKRPPRIVVPQQVL